MEKNWGFINKDDTIYIIKNLIPYTVLTLDHDTGKCTEIEFIYKLVYFICYCFKYIPFLNNNKWSLSTNPILYNNDTYIAFIHKFTVTDKKRLYCHHLILIDRETLLPKIILPDPIFNMMDVDISDKSKNYIHYISSIAIEDKELCIYFGESDINVGYSILNMEELDKEIKKTGIALLDK